MLQIANYDVYIFDCDGVILDSNQLKIDAMHNALSVVIADDKQVTACVDYFRNNFGRSRFHHVDIFIEQFLLLDKNKVAETKQSILDAYSAQCKSLYLQAELTPGFIEFVTDLKGKKFIASGSEQQELRDVFSVRGLDSYFDEIYGSPTKKSDLVAIILDITKASNAIMFGDAISDLEAAKINRIDFIAYTPFSNVIEALVETSKASGFSVIESWSQVY
jgi:phosphoglycolate phosphatase-like HAD superfamily hydrolase